MKKLFYFLIAITAILLTACEPTQSNEKIFTREKLHGVWNCQGEESLHFQKECVLIKDYSDTLQWVLYERKQIAITEGTKQNKVISFYNIIQLDNNFLVLELDKQMFINRGKADVQESIIKTYTRLGESKQCY